MANSSAPPRPSGFVWEINTTHNFLYTVLNTHSDNS